MSWPKCLAMFVLCLGAAGCATGAHRTGLGGAPPRGLAASRGSAPRQAQVSLPAEQPDIFMAAAAAQQGPSLRLSRYFPGLGKATPVAATAPTGRPPVSAPAARLAAAPKPEVVEVAEATAADEPVAKPATPVAKVVTNRSRPSWFGLFRSRGAHTYMTDVRGTGTAARFGAGSGTKAGPEPAYLPVALQVPPARVRDRAVLTARADVATPGPAAAEPAEAAKPAAEATADDRPTPPANPDSSTATAEPLSPDQPRLAVKPYDVPTPNPAPAPAPAATPAADVSPPLADAAEPAQDPAPAPAAPEPAATPAPAQDKPVIPPAPPDPRERPQLARPGMRLPEPNPTAGREPAAPATTVAEPATLTPPEDRKLSSAPTGADPGDSLGLPQAQLPATYVRRDSIAVRGSYQAPQPPPVLASPQVAPSPQAKPSAQDHATVAPATAQTWRRPCLRRLVRRMFSLGEFANPPTAKPH